MKYHNCIRLLRCRVEFQRTRGDFGHGWGKSQDGQQTGSRCWVAGALPTHRQCCVSLGTPAQRWHKSPGARGAALDKLGVKSICENGSEIYMLM